MRVRRSPGADEHEAAADADRVDAPGRHPPGAGDAWGSEHARGGEGGDEVGQHDGANSKPGAARKPREPKATPRQRQALGADGVAIVKDAIAAAGGAARGDRRCGRTRALARSMHSVTGEQTASALSLEIHVPAQPTLSELPTTVGTLTLAAPWVCRWHDRAGVASEAVCCAGATTSVSKREWLTRRVAGMTVDDRRLGMSVLAGHARASGRWWVSSRAARRRRPTVPLR